jgi:hypothetical protein
MDHLKLADQDIHLNPIVPIATPGWSCPAGRFGVEKLLCYF